MFLDVDGVLHPLNEKHLPADANYDEIIARGEGPGTEVDPVSGLKVSTVLKGEFLPRCMSILKKICDGAAPFSVQIILSSTWRETLEGTRAVNKQLQLAGLNPVSGCTPLLSTEPGPCRRAREILQWLKEHAPNAPDRYENGGIQAVLQNPLTRFVVIDDDDVIGAETPFGDTSPGSSLKPFFVRVDKSTGLVEDHAVAALNILLG